MYRSGVLVQVPRLERFAIHKLIVAERRLSAPDARKVPKDLMQASLLITALVEDRPGELAEAYHLALSEGVKWRARIEVGCGGREMTHTSPACGQCTIVQGDEGP